MSPSLFVARRYLAASRRQAQVGVVAGAALFGLALGVAALVIAIAVLAGFQAHVRGKLIEETPHVLVLPKGRHAFAPGEVESTLRALPGLAGLSGVIRGRVWLTLRGTAVPTDAVGREGAQGLTIELSQATNLSAFPGDEVTLVSSRTRLSPLGPVPIVVTVPLRELVPAATGRRLPEASMPLADARRLFALPDGSVTGYELRLVDPETASGVAARVRVALGEGVITKTWEEANRSLVLALRLERIVLFLAVSLIVVVAGLNLAATSAVLAATRTSDAAVLSVLGASPRVVGRVFLWAGVVVGLIGTFAGAVVGVVVSVVLDLTRAIPLPAEVYGLVAVPFKVSPADLALVVSLSVLWSLGAASLPARAASRRNVVEALRA